MTTIIMGVLDAFEGCLDAEIVGLQAMAALAREDKENQVGGDPLGRRSWCGSSLAGLRHTK
jgi:hypothetical protein